MMTVPTGVWMAKATASAMEWFTWMNSTEKQPGLHDVAGVMGHELRLAHKVVLLELELDEAQRQAAWRARGH